MKKGQISCKVALLAIRNNKFNLSRIELTFLNSQSSGQWQFWAKQKIGVVSERANTWLIYMKK